MRSVKIIGKAIANVMAIEKKLRDEGFQLIGVVAANGQEPCVYVYLEEGESKNPTELVLAHVNQAYIKIVSDKAVGESGSPEALANGTDKHVLTITKVDSDTDTQVLGVESLQIIPDRVIEVSPSERQFTGGVARLSVGPSKMLGPIGIRIVDQAGVLTPGFILLRFA